MSEPQLPATPDATVTPPVSSESLADGEWHRMHPLTPLFKGGLVLIVVAGIVIANMRDRVIAWVVQLFAPEADDYYGEYSGDPVDWVVENNFILLALLGVLALVVVLVVGFWLVWRFQQFRITGEHVEVRKGIVFRSHRRAPLDRVQGVNLTRPFPARLFGLAKLEVVGAGTDANVPLEYLATVRAESIRADILRLASGARAARHAAIGGQQADAGTARPGSPTVRAQLVDSMNHGVTGLIAGVDLADVAPESVVKIPTGRLVGSQIIVGVLWFVFFGLIFGGVVLSIVISSLADGDPLDALAFVGIGLGMGIPLVVATVGITWAQISKSLRYSIAPTPDGVRITYGLLTTVTETLPPGRIFAVELSQSLLWRPFGWWAVKINRMSGKSATQQQSGSAQQFNIVLPVGKREDVERVLALVLPDVRPEEVATIWEHGVLGPVDGDGYRGMPARAWWRRPLSWKRNGFRLTDFGLLLRRGVLWRKLAIFPLARLQGLSLSQGPIDRLQRVSGAQVHTVPGPITGYLSGFERDDALELLLSVEQAAVAAASRDMTHRWSAQRTDASAPASAGLPVSQPGFAPPPPYVAPTSSSPVVPPPPYAGPPAPPAPGAASAGPVTSPPPYVAPTSSPAVPAPPTDLPPTDLPPAEQPRPDSSEE